ncbi:DUF6673 family protein [[Clostridium] scindens]|uniref:DUF6673 family protein n=1 Tax=Clostridium scindens (strain JCM 10418 / VPI 12708) TaxID=29347 RepID=UPI0039F49592
MRMITVELQGQKVQADLLNPEVMKRFEDGFERAVKKIEESTSCEKGSEGIMAQCEAVIGYVTEIFGELQANRVFGSETDLLSCIDVLGEMQSLYADQVTPLIRQKTDDIIKKAKRASESDAS